MSTRVHYTTVDDLTISAVDGITSALLIEDGGNGESLVVVGGPKDWRKLAATIVIVTDLYERAHPT